MTPERIKVIQKAGLPEGDGEHVNPYDFETDEQLTWGELRALLATVGKTCEWRQITMTRWANSHKDYPSAWSETPAFCPDCGGRVVIRDGGTT